MTGEPVADERLGQYARKEDDLFRRLRNGTIPFAQTMNGLQDLIEGRSSFPSVLEPPDLKKRLERQTKRLVDTEAFKEIRPQITADMYHYQCEQAIQAFVWSRPLARICLVDIAIIDFRLRSDFIAEASGVYTGINPDVCRNFSRVYTPDDCILVIQYQAGRKYQDEEPHWCRRNFHPLEQGMTVKEGLFVYLYEGKSMHERCCLDLSGSVSYTGGVLILGWRGGSYSLLWRAEDNASPCMGSATRGKTD